MSKQSEAQRLADELEMCDFDVRTNYEAAAELRRLHEVNTDLLDALRGTISDVGTIGADGWMTGEMHADEYKAAVAAIAKATGGAA